MFIHDYLGVILIEWERNRVSKIYPRINGIRWKAFEPVEDHSFESTDKQFNHGGIIICYITGLRPEVIDLLVWWALIII